MKQDKAIGLLLIVFSGFMYYQADKLPSPMFDTLGADVFPKIVFVLLAIGGAILSAGQFFKECKTTGGRDADGGAQKPKSSGRRIGFYAFVIIGFLFFLLYVILMRYLGYLISTLLFLPVFMWVLSPRTKRTALIILLTALGLTFSLQYTFTNLLKVYLPEGSLF